MKCFISIVHQHCDNFRISCSAVPEGSVWWGRKDAWCVASFAGGGGGHSTHLCFFFLFHPPFSNTKILASPKFKQNIFFKKNTSGGERWLEEKWQRIDGLFCLCFFSNPLHLRQILVVLLGWQSAPMMIKRVVIEFCQCWTCGDLSLLCCHEPKQWWIVMECKC